MMTEVHIYHRRNVHHVFLDDLYAGIYSPKERTVRVRESLRSRESEIKTGFMRLNGVPVKVLAGDDELKQAEPLMEFPDHVKSLMTPEQGDRTPEVIEWARGNFPPDEFIRRYGEGCGVAVPESAAEVPAEVAPAEPEKPKRGRQAKADQ